MDFLKNNILPETHGVIFTINTESDESIAEVKRILSALPEIEEVHFNTAVYPNEMTVTTHEVLAIEKLQKTLIPYHYHALPKTLTG